MSFSKSIFESPTPNATSPDHIYYDIVITNRNSAGQPPIPLVFNETRNSPFILCPNDYFFSIIRFSLDTPSLPIFIPSMDLASTDNIPSPNGTLTDSTQPQPTIYSITLTYTDVTTKTSYTSEQMFINWIPEVANATIPNNTITSQDNSSLYYFCYSYQWFVLLCNNCFERAFQSLVAVLAIDNITLPTSNPPFFVWNVAQGLVILNADVGTSSGGFLTLTTSSGYNISSDPNGVYTNYSPISIYFNSPMYQLFNSFPSILQGYGNIIKITDTYGSTLAVPGGNFQIPIFSYGGQSIITLPTNPLDLTTTANFVQLSQEYSTIEMWNPCESIVFTSSTIPIFPEIVGTPQVLNNGVNTVGNGNNSNICSIVTDFQTSNGDYRSFINYTANVYRLIDLYSNAPLSNCDLTCYWKDRNGNLYPFYLTSGSTCSLKLMFRAKTLGLSS